MDTSVPEQASAKLTAHVPGSAVVVKGFCEVVEILVEFGPAVVVAPAAVPAAAPVVGAAVVVATT